MWSKGLRVVPFAAIYEAIYWADQFSLDIFDLDEVQASYNVELEDKEKAKVLESIKKFQDNKEKYFATISQHTSNWEKTYDLIKAVMSTSLIEYDDIKDTTTTEQRKKIVNKYVQIAQDMVGGNNPNLVFAIVGRMFGV